MNDRAIVYRRKYSIPHEWGTAVNVQTMVFGNMGETSATGVAFTRDPATGEKVFYGEYLINAQGEDVVAGVRTPQPIAQLAEEMPAAHKELMKVRALLEKHFRDMQDFEFTIEDNRLYMLQTRNGKRTGLAAVRIAVEMVEEKLITKEAAIKRVPADSLAQLLAPIFDRKVDRRSEENRAAVLPAGPGAASGHVVFSAEEAVRRAESGEKVLLARIETSPEDLRGMIAAEGILTARGGVSSHAALVARQMGKVCVCGAPTSRSITNGERSSAQWHDLQGRRLHLDRWHRRAKFSPAKSRPRRPRSCRCSSIETLDGQKSATYQQYAQLMSWVDQRTQARRAHQCRHARAGRKRDRVWRAGHRLCRTEHMFFEGDRIDAMREMILAENKPRRAKALAKLLPYQRKDFAGIFTALEGLPATIRFLDPPLHEFLPHETRAAGSISRKRSASRPRRSRARATSCTNSIRCSAIAAAARHYFIRRSPRCRRALFLKRPPRCRRKASRCSRKS